MAVPNPIVLLSISECQVRSEQYAAAVTTLRRYLEERPDAPDRAQVEAQIAKLEAKPAYLTVESTPAGALIFVDGQDTAKLTPAELELAAGEHSDRRADRGLSARRADGDAGHRPEGSRQPRAARGGACRVEPVAERKPYDGGTDKSRYMPVWIATGVAAAGLVTGSILGGLALKESSEFDDQPTESPPTRARSWRCSRTWASAWRSRRRHRAHPLPDRRRRRAPADGPGAFHRAR